MPLEVVIKTRKHLNKGLDLSEGVILLNAFIKLQDFWSAN